MIYDLLLAITSFLQRNKKKKKRSNKQRRRPMKELRKCWNNKDRSTVCFCPCGHWRESVRTLFIFFFRCVLFFLCKSSVALCYHLLLRIEFIDIKQMDLFYFFFFGCNSIFIAIWPSLKALILCTNGQFAATLTESMEARRTDRFFFCLSKWHFNMQSGADRNM